MRNRDLPPVDAAESLDRGEPDFSAFSIAQDFAELVDIFERQLQLVSRSDLETRAHISKAKEAAQRGVRLSEQLIGQSQTSA